MATFPPTLKTKRLALRRVEEGDKLDIFTYASDPELTRWMTFPIHRSLDDTQAFLDYIQPVMDADREFSWAIRCSDVGSQLLGIVSLTRSNHGLELGYALNRAHWGNGYVPEAATALREWSFTVEKTQRLWASCHIDNQQSARVLRKLGMAEEGTLRNWHLYPNLGDNPQDCYVFSMTPEDYALGTPR